MYYFLIILSVVMFGGCFALNDVYRRQRGSSVRISLEYSFITAVVSFIFLFCINGFKLEYTHFSLIMALLTSLNAFGFTYCAFKALNRINLSLYSLFCMLGGMALPFVQGIAFYDEKITLAKVLCFIVITAALLLTIEKGERKNGTIFYIGIFTLNGMSGVISKIFASSNYPKVSPTSYTLLSLICTLVFSVAILLIFFRRKDSTPKHTPASLAVSSLSGILNKVANLILVFALSHVDASVQYPMVTGGVMIVSTLICFFTDKKPSKKELISVIVAFVGVLLLFAIPI